VNNQRIRTRLSAYLEGDVSSREAARIESALEGSPELREELHGLQATLNLLRGLPRPDGPSALTDRVMERVRAGEGSPVRWRDRLHRLFEPTFAVPLVASAAALLVFVGTPTGRLLEAETAAEIPLTAFVPPSSVTSAPAAAEAPEVAQVAVPRSVVLQIPHSERQQIVRLLRESGIPNSAALASQFEPGNDIALASFTGMPRSRR